MKKLLALTLSLLMIFSGAASVFAADTTKENVNPYADAIKYLRMLEIFKGTSATDDGAEDPIQRYQMALFVSRIATGNTDDSYWNGSTNSTPFKDVVGNEYEQYVGAFSYAYQKNIIKGISDTEFDPASGITYQDALTMALRTIGYTDLTYPWGFIEKAEALGVTAGLEGIGYNDALNRGQTAQIIYNTLKAERAEGSTLLFDVFHVQEKTVVLVATDDTKYANNDLVLREEFVAFQGLGDNGATTGDVYYFGFDTLNDVLGEEYFTAESVNDMVGESFTMITNNNFKTLLALGLPNTLALENRGDTEATLEFTTVPNTADKFVANDQTYTLANEYSYLFNEKGTVAGPQAFPGNNEILVYAPYGEKTVTTGGELTFIKNINGDVLDPAATSHIVLKLLVIPGTYSHEFYVPMVTEADGTKREYIVSGEDLTAITITYRKATAADLAKYAIQTVKIENEFKLLGNSVSAFANYAYSDLKLINDYNWNYETETVYDRAIYTEYTLGFIKQYKNADDGKYYIDMAAYEDEATKFGSLVTITELAANVTVRGEEVEDLGVDKEVVNEFPALFYYNKQNKTLDILEVLDYNYGVISNYSVTNATVTIGGKTYSNNYVTLAGAQFEYTDATRTDIASYLYGLYSKTVKYILLDNKVAYIAEDSTALGNDIMVVSSPIGFNADGNFEVNAYIASQADKGIQKVVINSVDNWYWGSVTNPLYNNGYSWLQNVMHKGAIFHINSQATGGTLAGTYNVSTTSPLANIDGTTVNSLTFANSGFVGGTVATFDKIIAKALVAGTEQTNVKTIATSSLKNFIFVDDWTGEILTANAFDSNAAINNAQFYWINGTVVAVVDPANVRGFNINVNRTYVMVTKDSTVTTGDYNQTGIFTSQFLWNNLYDFKKAANVSNLATNMNLVRGHIYEVVDGIIVDDVTNLGIDAIAGLVTDQQFTIIASAFDFDLIANDIAVVNKIYNAAIDAVGTSYANVTYYGVDFANAAVTVLGTDPAKNNLKVAYDSIYDLVNATYGTRYDAVAYRYSDGTMKVYIDVNATLVNNPVVPVNESVAYTQNNVFSATVTINKDINDANAFTGTNNVTFKVSDTGAISNITWSGNTYADFATMASSATAPKTGKILNGLIGTSMFIDDGANDTYTVNAAVSTTTDSTGNVYATIALTITRDSSAAFSLANGNNIEFGGKVDTMNNNQVVMVNGTLVADNK